ncbi:4-fold beta flower protein [Duganella sp. CT11-25]|uniref:4-fold beta flower protein n=1 Tax=unclassified Duganella TaxID=2636909 RepID=UPI0039AF6A4A
MADWIIDRNGTPVLILDEYCFRSPRGDVTSWLFGNGVYALNGDHIGWFDISTLYDVHNHIVGMLQHACTPQLAARVPAQMPPFPRRPQVPLLKVRHVRAPAAAQPSPPPPAMMYAGGDSLQLS